MTSITIDNELRKIYLEICFSNYLLIYKYVIKQTVSFKNQERLFLIIFIIISGHLILFIIVLSKTNTYMLSI